MDETKENMAGVPPVTVPKMMQYGQSYAHAHVAQAQSGRVASSHGVRVIRNPNELQEQQKPQQVTEQQPEVPRIPRAGFGLVKSVPSGDTLVLKIKAGREVLEMVIGLTGIQAPRVARGRNGKDEPLGFEAREFLRKKCIGKSVQYEVAFTAKSGKDFGKVLLEGKENLAESIVAAGLANVAAGNPRKDGTFHPDRQRLIDLKTKAEEEGVGLWKKGKKPTRVLDFNAQRNVSAFVDANKGKPLPAILDRVLDGSTHRVEILGSNNKNTSLTIHLSGVQAPRVPTPLSVRKQQYDKDKEKNPDLDKPAPKEEVPPPYAIEAKNFVEDRLLHRDIHVVLEGYDKVGNVFASLQFPAGNISALLLKRGLAKYVSWSGSLTKHNAELQAAEAGAKQQRLNIWRDHNFDQPQQVVPDNHKSGSGPGVYDDSFTGKVVQVISGDTLLIRDNNGNERRFYLASVSAPRLGNRRSGAKDEPWAQEAKEYLRKKLIGKKVKVQVEYTRKASARSADQSARPFVSVTQGKSASVSEGLISSGFATVNRHRIEDPRAQNYEDLIAAEERAKKANKGIHGKNPPVAHTPIDLTERFRSGSSEAEKAKNELAQRQITAKCKQFLPFLQREKALRGVVEYVFSGSRFKVHIPHHNCIISFGLAGVRCPTASGAKKEPFGEESLQFARELCQQQDVRLEVETLDKGDNFRGSLFVGTKNLALILLESGLAQTFAGSADRSPYKDALYAAEESARSVRKGLWKDWTPPKPSEVKEEKEDEGQAFKEDEQLVNITVTEILDPSDFFVHFEGDKRIEQVEQAMKAFGENFEKPAEEFKPKKGSICAGLFEDGQWYRVRVSVRTGDNEYNVSFIDYGNSAILTSESLAPLTDPALAKLPPIARHCTLAGLKGPHAESEYYGAAREAFMELTWDKKLLGKVHLRDGTQKLHISLHVPDTPDSVNKQLLRDGLLRIVSRPDRRLKSLCNELREIEDAAKRERLGIWEFGDVSDPEEEDFSKNRR